MFNDQGLRAWNGTAVRPKGPAPEVSDKPLEGRNTDVERPFMRFNEAPRAEDVRPLEVLREVREP